MAVSRIIHGFVAGFLAVLLFHQAALLVLHLAGIVPGLPWNLTSVPPFGVPAVLSAAFWGGLWGVVFALLTPHFGQGGLFLVAGLLFGAVAPTLVVWFMVAPLKGQPLAAAFTWPRIIIGPVVNGAWGFGTALLLTLLPAHRRPA